MQRNLKNLTNSLQVPHMSHSKTLKIPEDQKTTEKNSQKAASVDIL